VAQTRVLPTRIETVRELPVAKERGPPGATRMARICSGPIYNYVGLKFAKPMRRARR